jgi:hypothetical protein
MTDINDPLNQNINKTDLVEEPVIKSSSKIQLWIEIFIVLTIITALSGFVLNNFVHGKNQIIPAKNENNGVILNKTKNINKDFKGSTVSGILSVSPTLLPHPSLTSSPTTTPKLILTPTSTSIPAATTIPTPTVAEAPIVATPKIDSISPSTGPAGQEITIKGYNFGSSSDTVVFCPQGNCSYGAPINSWSDTEIKARVPGGITQSGTYDLYVTNKNGKSSNRVSFTISVVQPIINSISPSGAKPGGELVISGSHFGGGGQVNFYKSYPSLSGSGNITSWSDSEIRLTIPSSFEGNTEYGIEVVSGGVGSSFEYYTLGAN